MGVDACESWEYRSSMYCKSLSELCRELDVKSNEEDDSLFVNSVKLRRFEDVALLCLTNSVSYMTILVGRDRRPTSNCCGDCGAVGVVSSCDIPEMNSNARFVGVGIRLGSSKGSSSSAIDLLSIRACRFVAPLLTSRLSISASNRAIEFCSRLEIDELPGMQFIWNALSRIVSLRGDDWDPSGDNGRTCGLSRPVERGDAGEKVKPERPSLNGVNGISKPGDGSSECALLKVLFLSDPLLERSLRSDRTEDDGLRTPLTSDTSRS
jgi:hypothetical protein